ncbi:MAG: diguanylate cyclase [Syntrophomonadaceae bacterium]
MNRLKLLKKLRLIEDGEEIRRELSFFNLERARLFIIIILLLEFLLFLIDDYLLAQTGANQASSAFTMFLLVVLFVVSVVYLFVFDQLGKLHRANKVKDSTIKALLVSYLTLAMIWGALFTFSAQNTGGSLASFLIILLLGSLLMYMDNRTLLIPYLASVLVFIIGHQLARPPVQALVRHYMNLAIFLVLAWFISRNLYKAYTNEFKARGLIEVQNRLLKEANQELLQEIFAREEAQKSLETANQELVQLSLVDQLTGIPNRRSLELFLSFEWRRGLREHSSVAIIMIDIDRFKTYNDSYGHVQGDKVLARVAAALDGSRGRSTDFVARYGGEEFLFIALNIDNAGTFTLAEIIRKNVETLQIRHDASPSSPWLTISLGALSIVPGAVEGYSEAINMADLALYDAKRAGGNQTRIYRSPQETLF